MLPYSDKLLPVYLVRSRRRHNLSLRDGEQNIFRIGFHLDNDNRCHPPAEECKEP